MPVQHMLRKQSDCRISAKRILNIAIVLQLCCLVSCGWGAHSIRIAREFCQKLLVRRLLTPVVDLPWNALEFAKLESLLLSSLLRVFKTSLSCLHRMTTRRRCHRDSAHPRRRSLVLTLPLCVELPQFFFGLL